MVLRNLSDPTLRRLESDLYWACKKRYELGRLMKFLGDIRAELKRRANDKECRRKYLAARAVPNGCGCGDNCSMCRALKSGDPMATDFWKEHES
jgi:hypothetical protein